ncbi:hypothetical protein HN51_066037, partial [Arachis hypogaea]
KNPSRCSLLQAVSPPSNLVQPPSPLPLLQRRRSSSLSLLSVPIPSPVLHCSLSLNSEEEKEDVTVTWQNLWVTVADGNKRKPILQGLTGYAQPGKLLAIMGPSGCGKSTLLDALSGRLSSSVKQTGKILINGHKQALAYGTSGYVTQDDAMLSTLTAGETLYYSAQLQFPDSMSTSEKKEQADITLREMGLQDAIDTRVGGWGSKGLRGTQQVTHRGNKEGREELLVVLLSHIQILRVTIK